MKLIKDTHRISIIAIILILVAILFAIPALADTEPLRPNNPGDYSEWSVNDTTDYGATSDQGDSTYIYTLTEGHKDLMNIADHATGSGTINSVTVWMRVQVYNGGGKAESGATYIKTNGNYYQGSDQTFPDEPDWSDFSEVYTDNPQNGSGWTWDEVDTLQAGVITILHDNDEEMRCADIWIIVDYTHSSKPTVTTQDATNIQDTTSTGNGTITNTGGADCDEIGVEWGINSGGPYTNIHTEIGSFGVGAFTKEMTEHTPETTIYYRAKAHNSDGWGYGEEKNFVTKSEGELITGEGLEDLSNNVAIAAENIAAAAENIQTIADKLALNAYLFFVVGLAGLAVWQKDIILYIGAFLGILLVGLDITQTTWSLGIPVLALAGYMLYRSIRIYI